MALRRPEPPSLSRPLVPSIVYDALIMYLGIGVPLRDTGLRPLATKIKTREPSDSPLDALPVEEKAGLPTVRFDSHALPQRLDCRLMGAREGGLLKWQWSIYPDAHVDRRNLALHAASAPLFVAGTCPLLAPPFPGPAAPVARPAPTPPATRATRPRPHSAT